MKRILTIGILFLSIIYAMPAICLVTQNNVPLALPESAVSVTATVDNPSQSTTAEAVLACINSLSASSDTITVSVNGMVIEMGLEQYVAGVVAAEISPDFPTEALKAQAVAARTYAVYKQQHERTAQHADADVCTDYTHCSAYCDLTTQAVALWGENNAVPYAQAIVDAVESTAGQIVLYENAPALTVFSAASTTQTESAADVWGAAVPYLVSVTSASATDCPSYYDEVTYTADQVRDMVAVQYPTADLSGTPDTWFKASERSDAGGIIAVLFGGVRVEGSALRTLFLLNSTNFTISTTADAITFHTLGYGHGVGLSQWGARQMALEGADYLEILTHYYTDTTIGNLQDISQNSTF